MSTVSESKPWCDITSEAKELGMLSQPLMAASPRFQMSLSVLALTRASSCRVGGLYAAKLEITF
jgi:hypothetical protein